MTDRVPVTLARKARGAPVPKTSVELVHGGTMDNRIAGIIPVHQVPVRHTHFTSVSDRADAIARGRMLLSQLVFLPCQPFQGFEGLIGSGPTPSARWFRGNLAFGNEFLAPESVAGGSDGDAFFQGVKVRLLFEFLAEFSAPGFQQFHV